jgi:transcriptional regulator with XRE-family HTH domain
MSTTAEPTSSPAGAPELTALGRQLEMLRLERGLSKQGLARHAGTSRQQLWRVMTGKSELTSSLCHRLAEVLGIDSRALRNPEAFATALMDIATRTLEDHQVPERAPTLASFVADPERVARTLSSFPGGDPGRQIKRRFLDALEDAAGDAGVRLPPAFFTLRGRVVNGEL